MLGLRLRVHDVLPGLAALKPRRIRRMTTDEGRELLCNIQGPIAARLIAISQARSLPAALRTSYQFFDDLLARFAVLPTACRKWPGHRHPPVLRIAKYPGDWERGDLTKCESKFASPQSSPSKSCNEPVSYGSSFRISAHISGWPTAL